MKKILVAVAVLTLTACGCGYTTKSLLPSNYKTIYVDNFKNAIKITAEQSNERMYRGYKPGMEIKITKAGIFLRRGFDGRNSDCCLKIVIHA